MCVLARSPGDPKSLSFLSYSSTVAEGIILPFPPFTHLLPLFLFLSLSLSTVLITHPPQSSPSFRAFEVILTKILLSYTADKTSEGCIRGPMKVVCVCVCFCFYECVCVPFCCLNHKHLPFHLCFYPSHKRKWHSRFLCVRWANYRKLKSPHAIFGDGICARVHVCFRCALVPVCNQGPRMSAGPLSAD